jgi:transcription factor TFIIIB component B''
MTGKDFSGPTPEILAPAALSLAEHDKPEDQEPMESPRKESATPGMASDGAEVLGDAASFDKPDDA